MEPSEKRITISPTKYLNELQKALADQVADLRNTLRSLEDGSFADKAHAASPSTLLQIQLGSSTTSDDPIARAQAAGAACNRCFISLIRSLLTFLDRLIAMRRLTQQELRAPFAMSTFEEVQAFVDSLLDDSYKSVARDHSLTNPRKLDEFPGLSDIAKKSALSYFSLRRCLEHHNGVPDTDINIYTLKITMLAGDEEITALPHKVEGGTVVGARVDEVEWTFPPGVPIVLTELQVQEVFFTIEYGVAAAVLQSFGTPSGAPV